MSFFDWNGFVVPEIRVFLQGNDLKDTRNLLLKGQILLEM